MKILSNLTAYPGSPSRILLHGTYPEDGAGKQKFNDFYYELSHNEWVTIPDTEWELLLADVEISPGNNVPSALQEVMDTPNVTLDIRNDDGSPPDNGGGNGGGNGGNGESDTTKTIQTTKETDSGEKVTEAEPVTEAKATSTEENPQTTEARRRSRSQKKS